MPPALRVIYKQSAKIPNKNNAELKSLLLKAAVSVSTNLAMSSTIGNKQDQINYTIESYSSLMRLLTFLIVCHDLNLFDTKVYDSLRERIDEIAVKVNALKKALVNPVKKEKKSENAELEIGD